MRQPTEPTFARTSVRWSGVASVDVVDGEITITVAGNPVLGAIVGFGTTYGASLIDPTTLGTSTVIPATKTKGYYVLVSDDPDIVYEVQEGGVGAALAATNVSVVESSGTPSVAV